MPLSWLALASLTPLPLPHTFPCSCLLPCPCSCPFSSLFSCPFSCPFAALKQLRKLCSSKLVYQIGRQAINTKNIPMHKKGDYQNKLPLSHLFSSCTLPLTQSKFCGYARVLYGFHLLLPHIPLAVVVQK